MYHHQLEFQEAFRESGFKIEVLLVTLQTSKPESFFRYIPEDSALKNGFYSMNKLRNELRLFKVYDQEENLWIISCWTTQTEDR